MGRRPDAFYASRPAPWSAAWARSRRAASSSPTRVRSRSVDSLELQPQPLVRPLGDVNRVGAGALEDLLGALEVGRHRHPGRDRDRGGPVPGRVVENGPADDALVGDHHQAAVAGIEVGVGEGDVVDPAGRVVECDPIADPERLGHGEADPGDHVAERLAGREADDQAQHRARGEDAGRQPLDLRELAQGQGDPDQQDRDEDEPPHQPQTGRGGPRDAALRKGSGHAGPAGDHQAVDEEGDGDRDHDRDRRRDLVAVLVPEGLIGGQQRRHRADPFMRRRCCDNRPP